MDLSKCVLLFLAISCARCEETKTDVARENKSSASEDRPQTLEDLGPPQELPEMCPESQQENNQNIPYFEDPYDCNCYYVCDKWRRPMRMCCHEHLWWHPISQTCYYKELFPESRQEECRTRKQVALKALEEGSYTYFPDWLKERLENHKAELLKLEQLSKESGDTKPSPNDIPRKLPSTTPSQQKIVGPTSPPVSYSTAGPSNLEALFEDREENLGNQYRATGFRQPQVESIQIVDIPKENAVLYLGEPEEYDPAKRPEPIGDPRVGSKQGQMEDIKLARTNEILDKNSFGIYEGPGISISPPDGASDRTRKITIRVDFPDEDEDDSIQQQEAAYTQVFQTHAANQPSPPWMVNNAKSLQSTSVEQRQLPNAFNIGLPVKQSPPRSDSYNPFSSRRNEPLALVETKLMPEQVVNNQYSPGTFEPEDNHQTRREHSGFQHNSQDFDIQKHGMPERYQPGQQAPNLSQPFQPSQPGANQPQQRPTSMPQVEMNYLNNNYRSLQPQRPPQQPQRPLAQPQRPAVQPQRPQQPQRPPVQPQRPATQQQHHHQQPQQPHGQPQQSQQSQQPQQPRQQPQHLHRPSQQQPQRPRQPQYQSVPQQPQNVQPHNMRRQNMPNNMYQKNMQSQHAPQQPQQNNQQPAQQQVSASVNTPQNTYNHPQNLPAPRSPDFPDAKSLPPSQYHQVTPARYGMMPQASGPQASSSSPSSQPAASWPVDVSLKDVKSLEQSYANYYINQAFDHSGEAGEDIAGAEKDDLMLEEQYTNTQENTIEDSEALSLDRYYANLPDEYIYGHCTVQPNPANQELKDFIWGSIDLRQSLKGGETELRINMTGFNQKDSVTQHGFHIHEYGDLSQGCESAGSHYDPFGVVHGGPGDDPRFRHFGDLGNVTENADGEVVEVVHDLLVSLLGPFSVLGRAIVIHEKEDDLGRGQNEGSLLTGNAGPRLACCTIGLSDGARWEEKAWNSQWEALLSFKNTPSPPANN